MDSSNKSYEKKLEDNYSLKDISIVDMGLEPNHHDLARRKKNSKQKIFDLPDCLLSS